MSNREWLNGLKAGDEVAVNHGCYGARSFIIYKIERTTVHHIITFCGKYRRKDGLQVGSDNLNRRCIEPVTPVVRQSIAEDSLRRKAKSTFDKANLDTWRTMPIDRVKALADAIEAVLEDNNEVIQ